MNTNIWGDFQICISVPLKEIMAIVFKTLFTSVVIAIVKLSNTSIQNLFNVDEWTCMDSRKLYKGSTAMNIAYKILAQIRK